MVKKIIWSLFIILLVLLAAAALAYQYYYPPQTTVSVSETLQPAVAPDNKVIAGPVTAVSAISITVKKQDGTTATLTITDRTLVVLAGEGGQDGTPKKVSDIKIGAMVLVTPDVNNAAAQNIILLTPPPAQ